MMFKSIYKVLFIVFLFNCSCKSTQIENTKGNHNSTKAESSEFNLGVSDLPKLKREVNDFEFIFTAEQILQLTLKIRKFEQKTSNQIAIVSIKSIGNYTDFDKFALDLSNFNGVGLKEKNNGLSVVFSKNLRRIRINTGFGTEKVLTDEFCKQVIDQTIIPKFKTGNFYGGIENGLEELIAQWE